MRLLFLMSLLMIIIPTGAQAADFYVTHTGQSLNEVRQAVRAYKKGLPPQESITVWLEKGTHYLDVAVGFHEKDSGSEEFPIVYRSKPKEIVRISGGRKVEGFVPVTDASILARLDPSAHQAIVQADLSGWADVTFGEPVPTSLTGAWPQPDNGQLLQLFYEGERMTLARWPNEGYTTIDQAVGPTKVKSHGKKGTAEGQFTYTGTRPERWSLESDIYLDGFFFWDYAPSFAKVDTIDLTTKTIQVEQWTEFPAWHQFGYSPGQRYKVSNALSEIDEPGEWYFNRVTKILYFYPPKALNGQLVELGVSKRIIETTNTSWITFHGLAIGESRSDSIVVSGGDHVTFSNVNMKNGGRYALKIDGGHSHILIDSEVHKTVRDGVVIRNAGDRLTLTSSNHVVENNRIHDVATIQRGAQGIVLSNSVGVRIAHNEIYNMPHQAIKLSGNDHVVEYNHIYDVVRETNDSGAIYLGRDWTQRGHLIRFNYFHNIDRHAGGNNQAVYLDDMASGWTIYGNIFENVDVGILLGGGRDTLIKNNIFKGTNIDVYIDGRGTPRHGQAWRPDGTIRKALAAMPYQTPPWSDRYPELVNILDEEPGLPLGNRVEYNIFLHSGSLLILKEAKGLVHFNQNFEEGTPDFNTVMRPNFQVDLKSKSLELGFTQIPFHKIGKY